MSNRRRLPIAALFACVVTALPVLGQENFELGKMWTFENAPLDYFEKELGFRPTQEWLDHVRLSSIRFGTGCSSSFVSPRGLIMTNHHCVRDYVAQVSPKDKDWVRDGFFARSLADEVRVPGLTVQQVVAMEDVTAKINEGIKAGDSDDAIAARRAKNEAAVMEAATKTYAGTKPQIVKLYQGGIFQLYAYKIFDDIRLVGAPNLQTAHFGGDPDNFTYPRFGIDFSFCRAYEDGKPADTSKHFFKWSVEGPSEGELVFVTGNPGSTDRSRTIAQLEYMRDAQLPIRRAGIDRRIEILQEWAKKGADEEKAVRTEILRNQNGQKAFRGYHGGLLDPELMKRKQVAEAAFKEKVNANPDLKAQFGNVWDRLEEICKQKTALEPALRFQTPEGFTLLTVACQIVRAADASVPAERREQNKRNAMAVDVKQSPYDYETYADLLARAGKWLPKDDPFLKAILGGKEPMAAVKAILDGSKLGDKAQVKELLDGGADAVAASGDPAIVVARVLAPLFAANQARNAKLVADEGVQGARIGQALFAVYGKKIAPDATLTLRLADGIVKGFPMNGTIAPWRTTFYGMYGRNVEFENKHPFDLPPIWLERQAKIDLKKSVDFVSTNDIIGGNSGSPVINKKHEVVGLVFDGNIESLPNRYLYRDDVPRTVSVHTDAIMEALLKVYDASALADELMGKAGYN